MLAAATPPVPGAIPARRRWTPSLRLRLLVLVAATVLPLTAFGAAAIILSHEQGRNAAAEQTLFQARALRTALEGALDMRVTAAVALAQTEAARRGDWAAFRPSAADFIQRLGPGEVTLAVVGPDEVILFAEGMGTRPPGTRRADRDVSPAVFADQRPQVSNLDRGGISGRLGFSVDVPVRRDDGTVPYYVVAAFSTGPLNRLLEQQDVPDDWVMSIVDRNAVILARRPDVDRFVGQAASPDGQPHRLPRREGTFHATSLTGVPVAAAFARSERYGWTVGIGVPEASLVAPLRDRLAQIGLGGCIVLALSLTGAWLVARRIEESLRRVAAAPHTASTGLPEVDALAASLALRDAQMRATYLAAPVGLAVIGRDRGIIEVNDRLAALHGSPAEAHRGRTLGSLLGQAAGPFEAALARVLDHGEAVENLELCATFRSSPEDPRDLLVSILPVRDAAGGVIGASVALTEITERKQAEEQHMLLAREVDHRARNALALAQSVVGLTEAPDLPSFAAIVRGRIGALARAHTLLARDSWTGASLRDMAADELSTVSVGPAPRWELDGPAVRLSPIAAQPVAMVLHELATNALKYGALSVPGGRVVVTWRHDGDGDLDIRWEERDGPRLAGPPPCLGFGSMLIRETMRRQVEGDVKTLWEPEGLVCLLHLPAWATGGGERVKGVLTGEA